jgi:hypothetical protein
MRKTTIFLLLCFITACSFGQIKAVTETGKEVILYYDGTWKYTDDIDKPKSDIQTNPQEFRKPDNATFLLKSTKLNLGFWLDTKKWTFSKAKSNPEAEYELNLKNGDLYGMIITENIEVPLESLKELVMKNGQSVSPDIHIVKEEYRTVNGLKVLLLQSDGTIQGVKFSYYGYYFSSKNGTLQFIMYTAQNLLSRYLKECEEVLNGMVEVK